MPVISARGLARPSLRIERGLLRSGAVRLACLDEVGRGALAGPVTVGCVVVTLDTRAAPPGVVDSKLLSANARADLAPLVKQWAEQWSIGSASAAEVDDLGIVPALGLAASRALDGLATPADTVLLDGPHDYLTRTGHGGGVTVHTRVRADMDCSGVAAASILAKTTRDAHMAALAAKFPHYGWASNKGYGSPEHFRGIDAHGVSEEHRKSFRLTSNSAKAQS